MTTKKKGKRYLPLITIAHFAQSRHFVEQVSALLENIEARTGMPPLSKNH
jgi:hypothetical protein